MPWASRPRRSKTGPAAGRRRRTAQTTNSLFYKINATLSGGITSSDSSLTVSDSTNLKSSGVIMLDDEIINSFNDKYFFQSSLVIKKVF